MEDEILIVEELENRLATEAVQYKVKCDELWEQYKFDPTYFDTFISNQLLNEFVKSIYDRIRPLNNQEINRYLSLSLQQFKTHTPQNRHKAFQLNYFNTYWYPNYMEYKGEQYMDQYASHVWKHYTNHFNLFQEATQKIYDDFKTGLMSNFENKQGKTESILKDENFKQFIKDLEYNYPINNSPANFYHQWKGNLISLKREVLSNLFQLEPDARKPFINRLKFELEELLQHCQTTEEYLRLLYVKYEITEEQLLGNSYNDNPLHIAINSEPPSFNDTFKEGFNPDAENIQFSFYNYHYGKIIREAIEFLNQQAIEYGITQSVISQQPTPDNRKTKPILSFNYLGFSNGQDNVTALMNELKNKKLIDNETLLADFRKVFTESEIKNKIIWTGNISELVYFIKHLHNDSGKIKDTKQKQWLITRNCFKMADGRDLAKVDLKRQKIPANAIDIEKAIKIL